LGAAEATAGGANNFAGGQNHLASNCSQASQKRQEGAQLMTSFFSSHSFSEGYAWCVECIRQSVYASLATELEMNKAMGENEDGDFCGSNPIHEIQAVELLRQGQLEQAEEELLAFNSKADNKVASAASNNLALLSIVVSGKCCQQIYFYKFCYFFQRGGDKLEDAVQYCEQALSLDR
jgi:hypothetical protein